MFLSRSSRLCVTSPCALFQTNMPQAAIRTNNVSQMAYSDVKHYNYALSNRLSTLNSFFVDGML